MGGKIQKRLILCAVALLPVLSLSAQSATGQTDSLVRLLNARYLEQVETNGRMARKAIDATFLHNGTYLSSDSALWHVEDKVINFYGNVQLVQGESVLTSDLLDYLIDENLAQFRGSMVQLRNKQDNILRTRILDYNTADSLAVFQGGASMMSEDGQIIESDDGIYSNARNLFTFTGNVNMFTDSVFVRTDQLLYDSDAARADFLTEIDFWKDGRMLSAGMGWYRRNEETFFFRRKVHGLGETQESWSDSLYYYRRPNDILMLGNIQIQDQSRKVAAMGDRLQYVDSLSLVTLEKRASAALWDGEGEHADTTYLGATRFTYHTVRRCDVPEEEVKTAAGRLDEMLGDPIAEYRRRAAEQAAQAAAEALKDDPNAGPQTRPKPTAPENPASPGPEDRPSGLDPEPPAARDSLALRDSSATAGMTAGVAGMTPGADPEVSPRDTTYMSEKELRRALRTARRDARWAELDARDADKAAKKEARKAARQARRAARIAAREARQAEIDAAKLQKYIERYQQKQKRNEGRKQEPIPAGERPPGTEAGGELPPAAESE